MKTYIHETYKVRGVSFGSWDAAYNHAARIGASEIVTSVFPRSLVHPRFVARFEHYRAADYMTVRAAWLWTRTVIDALDRCESEYDRVGDEYFAVTVGDGDESAPTVRVDVSPDWNAWAIEDADNIPTLAERRDYASRYLGMARHDAYMWAKRVHERDHDRRTDRDAWELLYFIGRVGTEAFTSLGGVWCDAYDQYGRDYMWVTACEVADETYQLWCERRDAQRAYLASI